jgi:hypothetical protein
MARAWSRSAVASTYTWQLPSPSITKGTVACSRMLAMSDRPPRGIRQSTYSRRRMNSTAASRLVSFTSTRPSTGSPALARPSRSTPAMAVLDRIAPDDPRRKATLPDFRHSPKASLVTFGRFS